MPQRLTRPVIVPGDTPALVHAGEWRIARADVPPLPEDWRRPLFVQPPPMPDDDPEETEQ